MTTQKIEELKKEISAHEQEAFDSFERCDTDGFLSQWAHGLMSQEKRAKVALLENGGRDTFNGLYEGDRRVAAKTVQVRNQFSHKMETMWLLRDDEAAKFGRKWIKFDYTGKGRIMKSLGLSQREEMAKAYVTTVSNGTGLAGAATARVVTLRDKREDEWGLSATLL